MGDYADMALDDSLADWGICGYWDNEDDDDGDGPGYGRLSRRYRPAVKTCYHCGQGYLSWRRMPNGRWRLHTMEGQLHSCLKATPEEDFLNAY